MILSPLERARILLRALGGVGSGNFGHAGRPGEVGGSAVDVNSAAFKNWFANSKVVDNTGRPLRVYHGTPSNFDEFAGKRIWFTPNTEFANLYTQNDKQEALIGGNVMPLYVSMQNPYVWESLSDWANGPQDYELQDQGYDGTLFTQDGVITHGYAYKSTQLKSAISNRGTFDPNNPLITLGGPGSGNFGHAGRPGEIGGSAPESAAHLKEQRETGIAAVGKLLDRAIKEAQYSLEADTWDTLSSDVQNEVENEWKGQAAENSDYADNVDRSGIENDIISDLRKNNDDIIASTEDAVIESLAERNVFKEGYADWPDNPRLPLDDGQQFDLKNERGIDWNTVEVGEDDGEGSKITNLDDIRTTDGFLLTDKEKQILTSMWSRHYELSMNAAQREAFESQSYWDQVNELENDAINQAWNNLSDSDKFEFASQKEFTRKKIGIAGEPTTWVTGMNEGETSADNDYARTRAIANKLTELRTYELFAERGLLGDKYDEDRFIIKEKPINSNVINYVAYDTLGDEHTAVSSSNTLEQLKENLKHYVSDSKPRSDTLIAEVWQHWKNSSSNDASLAFQVAAAEELGGFHRIQEGDVARVTQDTGKIGMQQLKAYARAQWETTQYVMRRAGVDDVSVYRGLMLDGDLVNSTKQEPYQKTATGYRKLTPTIEFNEPGESLASVRLKSDDPQEKTGLTPWANYQVYVDSKNRSDAEILAEGTDRLTKLFWGENPAARMKLPDLMLQRSGLQSTTTKQDVANTWNGIGGLMPNNATRVVIRARVPGTSVLSIPVFGQNIKEEQEVVVIGTKDQWKWDAWRNKAPTFKELAIEQQKKTMSALRAAGRKLVIDLQKEDAGKPHWLNPVARAFGNRQWKDIRAAEYKFSSTQVQLNAGLVKFAQSIPDIDLAEKGREDDEHITIKWGLHTINPNDVVNALNDWRGPIRLTLGKTSFFETEDGDALIVLVDSPDLHRIHALLSERLDNTTTHPKYIPHATIAYLKPGIGKDYADDERFVGQQYEINKITFGSKHEKKTELQLGVRHAGGPGSGNFGHAGRPGEVGGSGGSVPTGAEFKQKIAPTLVPIAQKVYDDWDGNEDVYAGGGICHLIAEEIASKLADHGIEASTVSAEVGEQHVWTVAKLKDGVYNVDISPYTYERGSGYSWTKIQGVKFDINDIIVEKIDGNPETFNRYTELSARALGGPGSGNFGHSGRPGEVGGSGDGDNNIVDLIRNTGAASDYIHDLYSDDPLDAMAGNFDLNTVTDAEIEKARQVFKQRSQEMLRQKFGDTLTAYRGYTGTEGKWPTVSLTLEKGVAQRASGKPSQRGKGEVKSFLVPVSDVLSYSEAIGKGTFAEEEIIVFSKSLRTLGGPGSGNFGHSGRPGEVGGSGPARTFTSEEGYQWHEQGPVAEWAKALPYADHKELGNYSGFGYADINAYLRGTFTPRIINEFVRPATPEEMKRIGWDIENNQWMPSVKTETGYAPGHIVDPRDAITPESIAKFGHPGFGKALKDYAPDDPYRQVADGRIVVDAFFRPVEGGPPMMFSIQRPVPDLKYVEQLKMHVEKLNTIISKRGYVVPEAMTLSRAAYLPGVSYEDLEAKIGDTLVEPGFTSTMVGDAEGRLTAYVANGKYESIYKRGGGAEGVLIKGQDEVGAAMRMNIRIPAGTKVAPIEASRRLEHKFPRIPDPNPRPDSVDPQYWTTVDYSAIPVVDASNLSKKSTRSESEVLLGSGARFRIVNVKHGPQYSTGDNTLKPIQIIDVDMEYVGGGSSEGAR